MSSPGEAPDTRRRTWWTLAGLGLVVVVGIAIWLATRADRERDRLRKERISRLLQPDEQRRPARARDYTRYEDGLNPDAPDLLTGSWEELHRRGLDAFRAGRHREAEVALRSAGV
ncbi:MAG: hypothetical protein ACYS5V_12820, partial [Planctomycetota bacterium]